MRANRQLRFGRLWSGAEYRKNPLRVKYPVLQYSSVFHLTSYDTRKDRTMFSSFALVLCTLTVVYAQQIPDEKWSYVNVRKDAFMFWWLYGAQVKKCCKKLKCFLVPPTFHSQLFNQSPTVLNFYGFANCITLTFCQFLLFQKRYCC